MTRPRVSMVTLLLFLSSSAALAQHIPTEVQSFVERRQSCDHWRGEYGYDKERQLQINQAVCEVCPGTDARLKTLKKKHAANAKIMQTLNDFDAELEPKNKAEARHFCDRARKGLLPKQ